MHMEVGNYFTVGNFAAAAPVACKLDAVATCHSLAALKGFVPGTHLATRPTRCQVAFMLLIFLTCSFDIFVAVAGWLHFG